jgi:hypothetical protein
MSDHSPIKLTLTPKGNPPKGKGIWKFNNSLLLDEEYTFMIRNLVETNTENLEAIEDERVAWEYLKMIIRRETIRYSINKIKKRNMLKKYLIFEIKRLEKKLTDANNDDVLSEYENMKSDLDMLEKQQSLGTIFRSKARWVEEGEKSTKYFLNLEKRNYEKKLIKCIGNDTNDLVCDTKQIMDKLYKFYYDLYKNSGTCDPEGFDEFTVDNKLNIEDSQMLEQNITTDECKEALDMLPSGKTPGTDGLSVEFIKAFWKCISKYLMRSFSFSMENGELSVEQRRAVISLIPKSGKDSRFIKNWRPISVLNVDYKIYAKVIALRLKTVLPDLIHEDQCGYVQGRVIGENIRFVDDLLKCAEMNIVKGYLILVDFEKAFDSLDWNFLYYTLNNFNFGENFIKMVKLLYTDIFSAVQNNGHCTQFFQLHRGIRQGCPASAYLFILCSEMLSCYIRNSTTIKGINVCNTTQKILQFADDTLLLAKDSSDVKEYLRILDNFGKCSGLKVNKHKTELINLQGGDVPSTKLHGLQWNSGEFKYLGIWFSHDTYIMEYKNYRHKIDTIRNLLKLWKRRDLSLKGKVIILKSLALSQLLYPMSNLYLPKWVHDEVDKLFYNFLWNDSTPKIKRTSVIRDVKMLG